MATGQTDPRQYSYGLASRDMAAFKPRGTNLEEPTETPTTIPQALALMNGWAVADATSLRKGGLLAGLLANRSLDTAGRIEALYLATLSRRPRPEESKRLVGYVKSGGPNKDAGAALGDVFWALLNSTEFSVNH
jgi:hypothetical protein